MSLPKWVDVDDDLEDLDLNTMGKIAEAVAEWLKADSSGHDLAHAWRVFTLGVRIGCKEKREVDLNIIGAAALTHDLHRVVDDDNYVHPRETLDDVRKILEEVQFDSEKIPGVLHCVKVHDEYEFRNSERVAESVEAEIIQDADNLDAIGAVGIARNFAFTGVVGNPLWVPLSDEYSGLDHFDDKLLKLKDEMNTKAARKIAKGRHEFMKEFTARFEQEWYGER